MAYETKSGFNAKTALGTGRPFYATSTRFDYYNSAQKQKKAPHPDPLSYPIRDTFGKEAPTKNQNYSFGVGRNYMRKIYVDDIKSKGDVNNPGPGKYEHTKKTGAEGQNYSFAARLPHGEQALARSKKLPGPGSYINDDLTGKNLKVSVMRNTSYFSVGKEKRFDVPTRKVAAPAPDVYKPQTNLN